MNQRRRRAFSAARSTKTVPDSARAARAPSSEISGDATLGEVARDRTLEVEHGPNWLFVKVSGEDVRTSDHPPLADQLTLLLEQHFTTRVVLEFEQVDMLHSQLIPQLERLDQWVGDHDGVMRLCGLSADCILAIRRQGLGDRLRACRDREEAVFGRYRPGPPL
jgi:hypothetical protein